MEKIKIMLDAGHYTNYNQSNVYKSYYEGNMSWMLQNYLKEELEEYGFIVDTTRNSRNDNLPLFSRGKKSKGYDLFISLHSNACDNESVNRVVIIVGFDNTVDKLGNKLGEKISELMNINQKYEVFRKKQTHKNEEYYGVLRGANSVGVKRRYIIEHSFHTNQYAAKWLSDNTNLKKLAKEEAKVIGDYFGCAKFKFTNGAYNKIAKVICDDKLNVRSNRPNVNGELAPIIDTVQNGKILTIGYVYNNWASIYYDNKTGFINCDYLKLM